MTELQQQALPLLAKQRPLRAWEKPWRLGRRITGQELFIDLQFTAVFSRVCEGYIAFIEDFPGANTQGATLEETRTNLREAVTLVVEASRMFALEEASGADL